MEPISQKLLNININHQYWVNALEDAFAYLTCASPGEVVCILGPSRAGKSSLIDKLIQLLVGKQSMEKNGVASAISLIAKNAGPNGRFSTKSFTLDLLHLLKHPMYSISPKSPDKDRIVVRLERVTEHRLRQAAEHGLKSRKVKYLFVDEAQHILYSQKRSETAEAILDSWKCLAQEASLVLVLVGAYPLIEAIQKSPHLLGRKHQVPIPRYQLNEKDYMSFAALVAKYESLVSDYCPSGLLKSNVSFLHKHSLGCIGLLKLWLSRSLAKAEYKGEVLSKALLEQTKLSDEDLSILEQEIVVGEKRLGTINTSIQYTESSKKNCQKSKPFQTKTTRRTKGNRREN